MNKIFLLGIKTALALLVVFGIWKGLANILATDRGLDLTDEGLYLLEADPPNTNASWAFPFGWHTGILFKLVNYDIKNFRTFGAFLLVLAGGWLGSSTSCFVLKNVNFTKTEILYLHLKNALIGAFGVLLFYAALLLTPGYNWLNLFGIIISVSGYINLINDDTKIEFLYHPKKILFCIFVAVGIFITLPAKPSSGPMLYFFGGLFMFSYLKKKIKIYPQVIILIFIFLLLLLSLLFKIWQLPLALFFITPLQGPRFVPETSIFDALKEVCLIPKLFYGHMATTDQNILIIIILGLLLAIFFALVDFKTFRFQYIGVAIAIGLIVIGSLRLSGISFNPMIKTNAYSRFADPKIITSCFCLLACLFSINFIIFLKNKILKTNLKSNTEKFLSCIFLIIMPFIFAFGTSNGVYNMTSLATIFLLLIIQQQSIVWDDFKSRFAAGTICFVFTMILVGSVLIDSHEAPYRKLPTRMQTEIIEVGRHSAKVRVDKETAFILNELRSQSKKSGWIDGTPLLGVVWHWASTVPYFLGATVPDCLLLTLFGNPSSVEIAKYRLSHRLGSFDSKNAWILTSDQTALNIQQKSDINAVLSFLPIATKKAFPKDYVLAGHVKNLQLWKPNYHPAVLHKE